MKQQISISNEFFRKERDNYSNWGFAFWRELFQNSIDAGATQIIANVKDNIVTFIDNGCGMSREVLEDVYFCLGKTTKDSTETVGGFGKARILTCFSHDSYSLRSQNWYAEGSASSYEVVDQDDYENGTTVTVYADAGDVSLKDELCNYLLLSQFSCRVKSNISYIDTFNEWLYRRAVSRHLSFGTIHVNKSGTYKNELIVRVNGVPMFTRYIIVPYQFILEIDMDRSRDVLLSNRDSLHNTYQNELDEFIQTINVDKSSLTDKYRQVETLGDGCFTSVQKPKYHIDNVIFAEGTKEELVEVIEIISATEIKVETDNTEAPVAPVRDAAFRHTDFERRTGESDFLRHESDAVIQEFPRIVIYRDCYSKEMKLASYRYNPNNWRQNQGRDTLNLLRMWTIACRYAIDVLIEIQNLKSVEWATGFLFSEETEAMRHGEGVHTLLLCPVDLNGKKRFKLRDYSSRMELVALAIHEVTHIVHSYHNEDYACLLTDLSKKVMAQSRTIQKDMSGVLR